MVGAGAGDQQVVDGRGRRKNRSIVRTAVDTIAGGYPTIPADYLACYHGDRFAESMRYARRYPEELPVLAGLLPQITCRSRSSTAATTA